MAFVTVENNQSIWDIALQVYGDYSAIEQMMLDNPAVVNFNDALVPGTKLVMNGVVINKNVIDYFAKKGIKPATAMSNEMLGDGISIDEIGDTLIL